MIAATNSDTLRTVGSSTVIRLVINPLVKLKEDAYAIYTGYQRPEHIIHLIFVVIAMVLGNVIPVAFVVYANWIGGIIESFGLSGILNKFATHLASTWAFSYSTSAIVGWGIKIFRKCVYGDWDYRMTSKQCVRIAAELEISTTELRDIFNHCIKLYRNPPRNVSTTAEEYKNIIEGLLEANPTALGVYYKLKRTLLDAMRETRENIKICKKYAQQISNPESAATGTASPWDHDYSLQLDNPIELPEGINAILLQQTQPSYPSPSSNAATQSTPVTLLRAVADATDTLTSLPTRGVNFATPVRPHRQPMEPDVELGQLPAQQLPPSIARPPVPTTTSSSGPLSITSITQRLRARANPTQPKDLSATLSAHVVALQREVEELASAIPASLAQFQGQERIEREKLIKRAIKMRFQLLLARSNTTQGIANIEKAIDILKGHRALLSTKTNEEIQKIIEDEEKLLAAEGKVESAAAAAAPRL